MSVPKVIGPRVHHSPSTIWPLKNMRRPYRSPVSSISDLTNPAILGEVSTTRQSSQTCARRALTTTSNGAQRLTTRVGTAVKNSKPVPKPQCALMHSSSLKSSTCYARTSKVASLQGHWRHQQTEQKRFTRTSKGSSRKGISAPTKSRFLRRLIWTM